MVRRPAQIVVGAQLGVHLPQPLGHRTDEAGPLAGVPLEGLRGHFDRLGHCRRHVDHREGGGLVVDEAAHGVGAGGDALAIDADTPGELLGGRAHRERQQPQARLTDHAMSPVGAGCGPQRRMGLLDGLGQHPPPGHLPVAAVPLDLVGGHGGDGHLQRLAPHGPGLAGMDAESLELGPGRRPAGAQLDPPVRQQVEHCDRLGGAHRVVVGLGHEPHPVAQPQVLGDRGQMAVEDLGVGAVRELLQEVVLHGPHRMETHPVAQPDLLDHLLVGLLLAAVRPGSGHRDLVEHGEFHGCCP